MSVWVAFLWLGALLIRTTGAEQCGGLLSFGNVTNVIKSLFDCRPARGALAPAETAPLQFGVMEKEGQFPDVLFTLAVVGGVGNVDLFCRPEEKLGEHRDTDIGPGNSVWTSNHTTGKDYVFISRDHPNYTPVKLTKGVHAAMFSCSVVGGTPAFEDKRGTEFEIEMDVDYSRRSLIDVEQAALSTIFEKCCQSDSSCREWKKNASNNRSGISRQDLVLDFCHLDPNVCDDEGYLLRLNMWGFGLDCEMPAHQFVALSRLEKLELGDNNLTGDVNDVMTEFQILKPTLQHLGLRNNRLTGSLSGGVASDAFVCWLVQESLSFVDLSGNNITGPIPNCLFDSNSKLEELHLSGNPLASAITANFTESRIRVLTAANSQLTGEIPASLALSSQLQIIDLSRNSLQGLVPSNLGRSQALEFVDLSSNQLTGMIPGTLAGALRLKTLLLGQNILTALPEEWLGFGAASENLILLDLGENRIRGGFPTPLARALNIKHFSIGSNAMQGTLPKESSLFPAAVSINLSHNSFERRMPKQWLSIGMIDPVRLSTYEALNSTEGKTSVLDLSHNHLTGDIPPFMIHAAESLGVGILLAGNNMTCPLSLESDVLLGIECTEQLGMGNDSYDISPNSNESGPSSSRGSGGLALASESGDSRPGSTTGTNQSNVVAVVTGLGIAVIAVAMGAVLYRVMIVRLRAKKTRDMIGRELDYWPQSGSADMDAAPPATRGRHGCGGEDPKSLESGLVIIGEITSNTPHYRKKSHQDGDLENVTLFRGPTSD